MEKLKSGVRKLGLEISSIQLEQFEVYYRELVDWNKRINLTAITDYEEVQTKHFLDSLTVALAFQSTAANFSLIDVGTGAGMPGIPIKILFPQIRLVLLDSVAKKAAFLHHVCGRLRLDDVEVAVGRAEEFAHLSQYREKFSVVLSRAVALLPSLVELSLPFAMIGGCFIAQKKGSIELEMAKAIRAINLLGGSLREVRRVSLEELGDRRQLVVIDKVSSTPRRYPRRPGIPSKRPLL